MRKHLAFIALAFFAFIASAFAAVDPPSPTNGAVKVIVGGGIDDTARAQALIDNLSNKAVKVAAGKLAVCGLTLPDRAGFDLAGEGSATLITATAGCTQPIIKCATASDKYNQIRVHDFRIDGTNTTNDMMVMTGCADARVQHISLYKIPNGKSGIVCGGVTQNHDMRFDDIEVYAPQSGAYAAIRALGTCADTYIDHVVGNGSLTMQYGIALENGSLGIHLSRNHPYNTTAAVLYSGGCTRCTSNDDNWDRAETGPNISINNGTQFAFTGGYCQAAQPTYDCALLTNTSSVSFVNTIFQGSAGAGYAIKEAGTTDYTRIRDVTISTLANWNGGNGPFLLIGANSTHVGVPGWFPLGIRDTLYSSDTGLAQNSTFYLGPIGAGTTFGKSNWMMAHTGRAVSFAVNTGTTPAAGQTFTANLQLNGANVTGGSCTISNGSFGCSVTLPITATFTALQRYSIQFVTSATSGTANDVRAYVRIEG